MPNLKLTQGWRMTPGDIVLREQELSIEDVANVTIEDLEKVTRMFFAPDRYFGDNYPISSTHSNKVAPEAQEETDGRDTNASTAGTDESGPAESGPQEREEAQPEERRNDS